MAEEQKEGTAAQVEPTFALGIKVVRNSDGTFGWDIKSRSVNISDEMVITLVRFWLKGVEERYYENFKKCWSAVK